MKKQQAKNTSKKNLKKVLIFGTFDGIHPGHIFFLNEAKKLGKLFVSVSSDKNASILKKKSLWKKENQRKKEVMNLRIAERVIVGDKKIGNWNTIKKIKPDIIALGYDQRELRKVLKEIQEEYKFQIKIIKSHKPKIYKSSLLKRNV